jgi:excisionase family DNA binding protein
VGTSRLSQHQTRPTASFLLSEYAGARGEGRGLRISPARLAQSKEVQMKSKDVAKKLHYRAPARVMTVRDVSAYLRVHPRAIYKLLKRHQIPAFHVGGDWRFNSEMIDTWRLAQGKVQGKLGG